MRYDALACRAWVETVQAETFGEGQGAVEVVRMICARDADIDATCVVESVSDRLARVVFDGPLRVVGVSRRADHMVATLRAVTGGRA